MKQTTIVKAFRLVMAENNMSEFIAETDFAKPIDQITESDLKQTLDPNALRSLRQLAAEMDRRQSVGGQFKRGIKRKGGRP